VVTFRTKMPGSYLLDVSEAGELERALIEAELRPPAMLAEAEKLCLELHSYNDGSSSERVLNAVECHLDQPPNLLPKPRNYIRKLKVRRRLAKELRKTQRRLVGRG